MLGTTNHLLNLFKAPQVGRLLQLLIRMSSPVQGALPGIFRDKGPHVVQSVKPDRIQAST